MFHSMNVKQWRTPWPNTVAYYKLDGNANDSSGNGYHGTSSNMTRPTDWGRQVGGFNGSNGYISAGNVTATNFWTGNFTISSYVKLSWLGTYQWIVNKVDYNDTNWFWMNILNSNKASYFDKDSSYSDITGSTSLSTSVRYNVVFTRSWTTYTIYLNGVSDISQTKTVRNINNSYNLEIGRYRNVSWNQLNWLAKEIIIENRARTAQEVLNYYNTSK